MLEKDLEIATDSDYRFDLAVQLGQVDDTKSTGAFIAASRYASATIIPPSIISRGIGWQGINILLDSFFGIDKNKCLSSCVEDVVFVMMAQISEQGGEDTGTGELPEFQI